MDIMVTKLPGVTITQSKDTSLYEYNACLDKQLDCLDSLIKDVKAYNESQWVAGTTEHKNVSWHNNADESEYTPELMWKLLYIIVCKHNIVPLFDFDEDSNPKHILSSKIKIFPIEHNGKLIHCAELIGE